MPKLTLARADDWEGLYLDGKLMTEGHSYDTMEAIQFAIEHGVTEAETKWVDDKWMHEQSNLPSKLSDVKLAQ